MNRRLLPIILLLATVSTLSLRAQVVINELMQSNIDCVMDDQNEFPDSWVELYNNGNTVVNLSDYSLGITADQGEAWKLPSRQLPPHQFVIIYCDKVASGLHTSFRLESGKGGSVFLFKNKTVTDKVTDLKKQPAPNIAYGREKDGDTSWGYQATPTPGASNCGKLCTEILGEPVFSEKGKVITDNLAFQLGISLPKGCPPGTVIRYTTTGEEPTAKSTIYTTPIKISDTRIIRAKLFCEGYLSPISTSHSFIFFPRKLTLPVVSIVTDDKYFYDSKLGIYVDGNYSSGNKNYKYDWRRPINFEFFERVDQESRINQLCETRIQGGASRDAMFKSLAVYANKRFGEKRLKYEFFPDQRPGVTDFKSIILRNAGNDFDYLYMRDAIIQRVMGQNTDLDWQAWRPTIVYINGIYKGILNIRERSNEDNIYTNYDGLEDIDMLENWGELKEGDKTNWRQFRDFYSKEGHTLEEYSKWIDWKEFINLMIMNLYFNNQDFPGNNIVMWRPRTEDGLWRFVAKDTDFGIGLYDSPANYNSIEWLYDPNYDAGRNWANKPEHTILFRNMMEDVDFKREFLDHATVYMGDFLNAGGTREIWDPMYEMIKTEYPFHRKLINQWWPNYTTELNKARNWMASRTDNFYNQLAKFYDLGKTIPVEINLEVDELDLQAADIYINGIRLTKGYFNGKMFDNRSYTVSSSGDNGRKVVGWTVSHVNATTKTTKTVKGSSYTFTVSDMQKMWINAIYDDDDGIDSQTDLAWKWRWNEGVLTLYNIDKGTRVVLYDLKGIPFKSVIANGTDIQWQLPANKVFILKVGNETLKLRTS